MARRREPTKRQINVVTYRQRVLDVIEYAPGSLTGHDVAELTGSYDATYPYFELNGKPFVGAEPASISRIIRGGDLAVIEARSNLSATNYAARKRTAKNYKGGYEGVGFRCARSVRPRMQPEDFIRILPQ